MYVCYKYLINSVPSSAVNDNRHEHQMYVSCKHSFDMQFSIQFISICYDFSGPRYRFKS